MEQTIVQELDQLRERLTVLQENMQTLTASLTPVMSEALFVKARSVTSPQQSVSDIPVVVDILDLANIVLSIDLLVCNVQSALCINRAPQCKEK